MANQIEPPAASSQNQSNAQQEASNNNVNVNYTSMMNQNGKPPFATVCYKKLVSDADIPFR